MTDQDKKNLKTAAYLIGGAGLLYLLFSKPSETDPTGNGGTYIPPVLAFNAKNVAEGLYNAMKDSGTEEEAIFEILKPVNQTQFAQVNEAFGKRSYNTYTGNQYNFNPFSALAKLDLKTWLNEELSAKDYAILRNKYPYSL